MFKARLIPLFSMFAACAGALTEVELEARPKMRPPWVDQGLKQDGETVWVTGQSKPFSTEQEARDNAVQAATMEFVKFAGVEVEAFDRSIETYAQSGDKSVSTIDAETRASMRAKAFVKNAAPNAWYTRKIARMRGDTRESEHFVSAVLLQVPKSELERVQSERAIKLSLDIQMYRQSKDALEPVAEGDVLRSGEAYGFYVQPSDGCWIYIYQTDAAGVTARLFPNADFHTEANPIPGGKGMWVPNAEKLFVLDQTSGKEKVYVFASLDKIPELENATELGAEQLKSTLRKMGVAGTVDKRASTVIAPPKGANTVAEIKKKLQAQGSSFVYETSFFHQ